MRKLCLALCLSLLLGGCKELMNQILAELAVDSAEMTQLESALASPALGTENTALTPSEAATWAAANVGKYYQPANCRTAVAQGTTVTFTLNNCTGPYGRVSVTGTIIASYTLDNGKLKATVTGHNLRVNNAILELDADVTIAVEGAVRHLEVATRSSGTGPRGHSITRTGTYTLSYSLDTQCLTLAGSWATQIDQKTWTTDVVGYERCGEDCPKAGGSISWHGGISDETVTVDFDGSDLAPWESSRGSSGTVKLNCVSN